MAELINDTKQHNTKDDISLYDVYKLLKENNDLLKENNRILSEHKKLLDKIDSDSDSFGTMSTNTKRWALFYGLTLIADTIRGKPL